MKNHTQANGGGPATTSARSGPPFSRKGKTLRELTDEYGDPGLGMRAYMQERRRRIEWQETVISVGVALIVLGFAALAALIIVMTGE